LFQKAHEEELPVVPWGNDRAAVLEPALLNVRPLRAEASACERINGWPYTEFSAKRQREGYGDRPIRIQRERDEGVALLRWRCHHASLRTSPRTWAAAATGTRRP